MGLTKSEIFTEEQNKVATIAKVLGHPARIAILEFLIKLETCVCGDLVKDIGLAQPTISQHLKELKKVGLIKGKIEGTSICYCIDQENWNKIKNTLNQFLNKNSAENCC
ncbi:MAG: ArsR family transcriptional regulator [Polaribacter sp.]|jgi:ArsR family transcriptional regulator